jgi:hypothetical protein
MAGSFGQQCTTASIAMLSHHRDPSEVTTVRTLLLEDDAKTRERILSSILMTPTDVQCVPTLTAALSSLGGNLFDVIVIDRHLGGWVSAQSCKDLVARAGDRPVVGLIDADCVLDRDNAKATPQQRLLLELGRNVIAIPIRKHQDASCSLAHALAEPGVGH